MNAFECLGIAPAFALDLRAVEQAYFERQRATHPDRAAVGQAKEKVTAMLSSIDLNEAYQILKSPLKRAQHLLKLQGIEVMVDGKGVKPDPALLAEVLEQREALSEAEDAATLQALDAQAKVQRDSSIAQLDTLFAAARFDEAAQETLRLGYLEKMIEESRQKQRRLMAAS